MCATCSAQGLRALTSLTELTVQGLAYNLMPIDFYYLQLLPLKVVT